MDTCLICETQFKRKYIRGGQRKLCCSRQCGRQYLNSFKEECLCRNCKEPFFVVRHFAKRTIACSQKCYDSIRNSSRKFGKCIVCSLPTTRHKYGINSTQEYCSRECAGIMRGWTTITQNYRRLAFFLQLKEFSKVFCEDCGIEKIECLEVHHIDKNNSNNSPENLRITCKNCHNIYHCNDSDYQKAQKIFHNVKNGTFKPYSNQHLLE